MPCYFPLRAWRGSGRGASGKQPIVFKPVDAICVDAPIFLPCGQCIGCRLERSRQWAIRCVHEASLFERNCFITLTYADVPADGSLSIRTFQLFMKRLRKRFSSERIRFFHCGEYGEKFGRPHYHACLFNFDFSDKVLWKEKNGNRLFTSKILEKVWGHGYCVIGEVTFDSAAYVARYIMKKVTGRKAAAHYGGRKPEYISMSRRPGIGRAWFDRFKSDVFPDDFVVVRGKKLRAPKFYDGLYELEHPEVFKALKEKRIAKAKECGWWERQSVRLRIKEVVKLAQIRSLKRDLGDDNGD